MNKNPRRGSRQWFLKLKFAAAQLFLVLGSSFLVFKSQDIRHPSSLILHRSLAALAAKYPQRPKAKGLTDTSMGQRPMTGFPKNIEG